MNPFRELDERVLPRLGRGMYRFGRLAGFAAADTDENPIAARHVRPRPRLLPGVALVCVAALAVLAVWSGNRPQAPIDETVGDVARVGVVGGDAVSRYVARSGDELTTLAGESVDPVWALVGLDDYADPAALEWLFADYTVARVIVRVPLPDVQTQMVTLVVDTLQRDVPAGMRRIAAEKQKLAAGAPGLSGALEQREADAYSDLCACAYAAVVRGAPARLRALADRPGIRVVDPAPEVTRLDRAVFVPLLPEQTTVVGPPPDVTDPTPAGAPSGAPAAASNAPVPPAASTNEGKPTPVPS
jgi:hypothetical protein